MVPANPVAKQLGPTPYMTGFHRGSGSDRPSEHILDLAGQSPPTCNPELIPAADMMNHRSASSSGGVDVTLIDTLVSGIQAADPKLLGSVPVCTGLTVNDHDSVI
jgi:hypothetical protein